MLSIILSTLFVSKSPIKPIVTSQPRTVVQTQSAASLYRRVKPYVVTVKTSDGTGSGFITDEGLLYTAYHVVRGSTKLSAVTGTGKSIPLKTVIAADVDQDWVCFQTAIKGNIHVAKHNNSPVGARVTVIGSPKGLAHTINEGLMSGRRAVGKLDRIQLSISGFPGSSGSPVFNGSGEVIGMVTGGATDTETITYAAPASRFVGRRGITAELVSRDFTDEERGINIHSVYKQLQDLITEELEELKISKDTDAANLIQMTNLALVINGNDMYKELINESAIRESFEGSVRSLIPRLQIVDQKFQDKRLEYWLEEYEIVDELTGLLSRFMGLDEYYRYLYVDVDVQKTLNGHSVTVTLTVNRGAFSIAGEQYWQAYSAFETGEVKQSSELTAKIKDISKTLVTKFGEKWNLANPEEKEDKDKK